MIRDRTTLRESVNIRVECVHDRDTMAERVTLLLGKERIEVSRADLISKSEYFATLLSPNFKDSLNSEQRINYDIGIDTLRVSSRATRDGESPFLPEQASCRHDDTSSLCASWVAVGYDIYLVGGEYGKNSQNYQTEIWRYSMISKTWYYVTSMPRARRNMAIQFSKEDLVIVGGTQPVASTKGSDNIDVYNVHTGQWRDIPGIPEYITNTTVIYDDGDFVALWENAWGYTYYEDGDKWLEWHGIFLGDGPRTSTGYFETSHNVLPRYLMKHHDCQYVLGTYERDGLSNPTPKVFWFQNFESYALFDIGNCLTRFDNQVGNGPYLVGFSHKDNTTCVEVVRMNGRKSIETNIVYKEKRTDVVDLSLYDPIGCFNVYNPESLNEVLVPKAKHSRNRAKKSRTQPMK